MSVKQEPITVTLKGGIVEYFGLVSMLTEMTQLRVLDLSNSQLINWGQGCNWKPRVQYDIEKMREVRLILAVSDDPWVFSGGGNRKYVNRIRGERKADFLECLRWCLEKVVLVAGFPL